MQQGANDLRVGQTTVAKVLGILQNTRQDDRPFERQTFSARYKLSDRRDY